MTSEHGRETGFQREVSMSRGAMTSLEDDRDTLAPNGFGPLDQLRAFLEGNEAADFHLADRDSAYAFVRRTLVRFQYYHGLGRPDKGRVREFLGKGAAGRGRRRGCEGQSRGWRSRQCWEALGVNDLRFQGEGLEVGSSRRGGATGKRERGGRKMSPLIYTMSCAVDICAHFPQCFRFWGAVTRPAESFTRVLRVVTLEDGRTIHNASFDRNFATGSP